MALSAMRSVPTAVEDDLAAEHVTMVYAPKRMLGLDALPARKARCAQRVDKRFELTPSRVARWWCN